MTAAKIRLHRSRSVLRGTLAAGALLWGLAAGLALVDLAMLVDAIVPVPRMVRDLVLPVAATVAIIILLTVAWRGRAVRSLEAVALHVEELEPALRYRLVTAVDPAYAGTSIASRLLAGVAPTLWEARLRRWSARQFARPALAALLAATALAFAPPGMTRRVVAPGPGDLIDRMPLARAANPLASLVVTVHAPRYVLAPPDTLEDPYEVVALIGSAIMISGRATDGAVVAATPTRAVEATIAGGRWTAQLEMGSDPLLATLTGAGVERQLLLIPIVDSAPAVVLSAPARDTVLAAPEGTLALAATLSDDHGLASAWFEVILSTGQGESFDFASAQIGERRFNSQSGRIDGAIDLAEIGAKRGAFLHIRAVARDRNTVSGPGVGVSETRTIRVARVGEYDSIAVEVLPPLPADSSLLSQRLLITLAEDLIKRGGSIEAAAYVRESRAIGLDQQQLRRRVAAIVFMRLGDEEAAEHAHGGDGLGGGEPLTPEALLAQAEAAAEAGIGEALDFHGDETPVVAINRPLLEAYNAMWNAGGSLGIGDPVAALPHMYDALEAIQRARAAERIYLRGRPSAIVVDIARVRLSEDQPGVPPGTREAGATSARTLLLSRFVEALELVTTGDHDLLDSLLVLRISALGEVPEAAGPLGRAIAELRASRDAAGALRETFAVLSGRPTRATPGSRWSIVP